MGSALSHVAFKLAAILQQPHNYNMWTLFLWQEMRQTLFIETWFFLFVVLYEELPTFGCFCRWEDGLGD